MQNKNLYGVILAGGSGSRLWPLSRQMYPKQLLKLAGEHSLFQSTFLRLTDIIPDENILTVTNINQANDIQLQLNDLKALLNQENDYRVLTEPLGRNTAPAIALSVFYVLKKLVEEKDDPILLVSPSDHLIKNQNEFTKVISEGVKLAENGYIVTFGIKPDKPDTGYGYIKTTTSEEICKLANDGLKVSEFKEKPNLETAQKYVEAGTYYWNGGIFMFKASTMLNELQKYVGEIFDKLQNAEIKEFGPTISFEDYEKLPNISIDYAVMEKSDLITLIPLDCGWSDLGSWEAIFETSEKDENNNYRVGKTIDVDSKNSLMYSTSKLVSTIGLDNIVVVETEDSILVCDKNKTQDVKKIFDSLKDDNNSACMIHNTIYKPWGSYTVHQKEDNYLTRSLNIKPGGKIPLQNHKERNEHFVVLSGEVQVVKNGDVTNLKSGESVDISAGIEYSLENLLETDLKMIEIQKGNQLENEF